MIDKKVVIFGEVLFDTFPDGSKTLGGAPFNVAWHLQAFGLSPLMLTRIGDDAPGNEVLAAMSDWGMDTGGVQIDPQLPTGKVAVQFDAGEPQYTILHPAAFDAIESSAAVKAAAGAMGEHQGVLYHGSLALRSSTSRSSLERLRDHSTGTTFIDVNLRPPWWERQAVLDWIQAADWAKLNEHELQQLNETVGGQPEQAAAFLSRNKLAGVILTRGYRGAEVLTADLAVHHVQPRSNNHLVDTVGAGDAFTSVMLLGLVKHWAPDLTLQRAQEFASHICGQRGAIVRDAGFYGTLLQSWAAATLED